MIPDTKPFGTTELTSAESVIQRLGGLQSVQKLCDQTHVQSVWNWQDRGWFPPRYYLVMNDALADKGCVAPDQLWKMLARKDARVA